jgi:hypothetical protein
VLPPAAFLALLSLFPIAIGFAVLRYRLWDVDLLINRTLVYGTLTGALAAVYFGSVVLLQQLFRILTGQASVVALVLSTLAIMILFQPLRRMLQSFIDHRFYRRQYDAARTLAAFSVTLRDEVDVDRLAANMVAVVDATVQPSHVSLWLRPPPSVGGGQSAVGSGDHDATRNTQRALSPDG